VSTDTSMTCFDDHDDLNKVEAVSTDISMTCFDDYDDLVRSKMCLMILL
jgi:hypothetical protein